MSPSLWQLKKIGRKYKEQAETISKDLDKAKADQQAAANSPSPAALEQATAPLRDKLAATEREHAEQRSKASALETQLSALRDAHSKVQEVSVAAAGSSLRCHGN